MSRPIFFLCDFDGVINAPHDHNLWVKFLEVGSQPDIDTVPHPERDFNPKEHFSTDASVYVSDSYTERKLLWSTELVDKIRFLHDSGKIVFIWVTGWKKKAVSILNPIFRFPDTVKFLEPVGVDKSPSWIHDWKVTALVEWYKTVPAGSPFIWVDDIVTKEYVTYPKKGVLTDELLNSLGNPPALIIHTDERYGLTRPEWSEIEKFLGTFS